MCFFLFGSFVFFFFLVGINFGIANDEAGCVGIALALPWGSYSRCKTNTFFFVLFFFFF